MEIRFEPKAVKEETLRRLFGLEKHRRDVDRKQGETEYWLPELDSQPFRDSNPPLSAKKKRPWGAQFFGGEIVRLTTYRRRLRVIDYNRINI